MPLDVKTFYFQNTKKTTMKKYRWSLALFCTISMSFAQAEKDSVRVSNGLYISSGFISQSRWDINQKLITANFPAISNSRSEFTIGYRFIGKKFSSNLETATSYFEAVNSGNETLLRSNTTRLNVSYPIINNPNFTFAVGLNASYAVTRLNLGRENAVIDLNNITATNDMGRLSLRSNVILAGPSTSLLVAKDKWYETEVRIAYEFALTNGRWYSDFVSVQNSITEKGNGRFLLSFLFPVFSIDHKVPR